MPISAFSVRPAKISKTKRHNPPPYTQFQLDYKDATTVAITPGGKKQHVVEMMNIVDVGTSHGPCLRWPAARFYHGDHD